MSYMLYHLHEFQKATMAPTHFLSEALANFYESWGQSLSRVPYGRLLMASNEVIERSTRTFDKPKFGLTRVKRDKITLTLKEDNLLNKPFCTLKHFKRHKDGKPFLNEDPKVLIVAPMTGHHATLLRDTVRAMAPWHDVYITDWANARDVPLVEGDFGLDDYIDYILEFMRFLGSEHHVIAVCQPSVPVLASIALLAAKKESCQPKSMTLMGGPIDTRINPGKVDEFSVTHSMGWFNRNLITTTPRYYPGAGRQVCPGFMMLTGFISMNPERHQEAGRQLFEHLVHGDQESVVAHSRFYDEYRAVMDLSASYFLESIRVSFKEHELAKGTMKWRGHPIDLAAIHKTALLTIEGEFDDISSPGQTYAAHALCSSIPKTRKKQHLQQGVGHYGIFNGRRWRDCIQPVVAEFIKKHV
jgi:poly(3-hydroxybutyrate) depolymerase